jgi:hypothetical protein
VIGLTLAILLSQALPDYDRACGPICLSAYLRRELNCQVSAAQLYSRLDRPTNTLTSFADLTYLAKSFGVTAEGRLLEHSSQIDGYAIIPIDTDGIYKHFVLVKAEQNTFIRYEPRFQRFIPCGADIWSRWVGFALLLPCADMTENE